jgi:hypothetical protein
LSRMNRTIRGSSSTTSTRRREASAMGFIRGRR